MRKKAEKLIILTALMVFTFGCAHAPEEKLESMGISFDAESFLGETSAGNLEAVELFLKSGMDVNKKNPMGKSALLIASTRGHAEIVRFLLKNGAEVNAGDIYEVTPVIAASWHGRPDVLNTLIDAGGEVNAANTAGITALMWSAYDQEALIAKTLIRNGADIHAEAKDGWTAVTWAALRENLPVIKLLKSHGADLNHRDPEYRRTPLMEAAAAGKTRAVRSLIEHGAETGLSDNEGYTALMYAAAMNESDIVKALLEGGADPNSRDGRGVSALMISQSEIYISPVTIRNLLAGGAEITAEEGDSPEIFTSAARGEASRVREMLESEKNLPEKDAAGWPIHFWAVVGGSAEALELFIKAGADPGHVNKFGLTPLLIAIMDDSKELIRALKNFGADIEKTSPEGMTPLMTSIHAAGVETAGLLIELGADVNRAAPDGMTPLMASVLTGDIEKVRLLLEKGADVHAREKTQELTARMIAENFALYEIAALLEEHEKKTPGVGDII